MKEGEEKELLILYRAQAQLTMRQRYWHGVVAVLPQSVPSARPCYNRGQNEVLQIGCAMTTILIVGAADTSGDVLTRRARWPTSWSKLRR